MWHNKCIINDAYIRRIEWYSCVFIQKYQNRLLPLLIKACIWAISTQIRKQITKWSWNLKRILGILYLSVSNFYHKDYTHTCARTYTHMHTHARMHLRTHMCLIQWFNILIFIVFLLFFLTNPFKPEYQESVSSPFLQILLPSK